MQDYRPPSAPLSDSRVPRRQRSLVGAIAVGLLAAVGLFIAFSIACIVVVALMNPSVVESDARFAREIRGLRFYTQLTGVIYVLSAALGGWSATRWKRGRWLACAVGVSAVLVTLGLGITAGRFGALSRYTLMYLLFPLGALVGGFLARDTEVR